MTSGVPATVTGARRDLGEKLAQFRKAAGYGQVKFAPPIGWSRSTLANVEIGRQHVPRAFWESCERLLPDARGILVAAYDEIERLRRDQHGRSAIDHGNRRSTYLGADGDHHAIELIHQVFGNINVDGETIPPVLETEVIDAYRSTRAMPKPMLALIGGYAGSGKSEFGRFLSTMTGWAFVDKDAVTRPMTEALLASLGADPHDRQSKLYKDDVRPYEYRSLLNTAYENLDCNVSTVTAAPFLEEFDDSDWLERVRHNCRAKGARLAVIWMRCDADSMFDYLTYRSASRDSWKLAHWEEYLSMVDYDFRPLCHHYVADNNLNAAISIADQARELATRVYRAF